MTEFIQFNKNPSEKLIENRDRLIARFLKGNEPRFTERHAEVLDDYFQECFGQSKIGPELNITKNPYAIIALGGYGRKEQCLFSDIDLMFLFEKKVLDKAEDLIKEMVYPLWDIGLDVGHATRSIKECVALSKKDISVLTSLLDARFICGMSNVYMILIEQLRQKVLNGKTNKVITSLIETNDERHTYFGDSSYLLEPNLKEGVGGLRDYHTMLWVARIRADVKEPRDLEYEGFVSHDEFEGIARALLFIFEVRSRLHHLTGRKSDRLHFEYQIQLAKELNFKSQKGQTEVEQFLGKLHGEMEFIKQQYRVFLYELGYGNGKQRKKKPLKQTKVEGLEINRGMINFSSPEDILTSPSLLVEIFRESDRYQLPLSGEAKRLVREFSFLIDGKFTPKDPRVKLFERILVHGDPSHNVLNEMLDTGVLVRFIPEFKGIVNRIQFDEYHLYPVDKHSFYALQIVQGWRKQNENNDDVLYRDIYQELSNPALLHWATLLHDVGKGQSGDDHSKIGEILVHKILKRFGFKEENIDTVAFLVKEHLFLIKIATRRDIHDEETCINCARRIKNVERLKMLYLLTVADSMSTGPNAWNEWTATLLRNLFLKVLKIIEKGELASEAALMIVEEKKQNIQKALSTKVDSEKINALIHIMSPRYLLSVSVEDILNHLGLYEKRQKDSFIWEVKKNINSDTRTVTVCAKDAPGLFSKIAGTFTLNGIDILNAQVFTWRNNTALDIFEVKPPPDLMFEQECWERAKNHLQSVLEDRLHLASALEEKMKNYKPTSNKISERPCRVVVDNESSSFFTIIEVFAYDYLGLLFNITDVLFRLGLDVWVSKIATKVDQVVDVFYVRDFDGQRVDSKDQEYRIKNEIEAVLNKGYPS